jgi:hypothetical protein
MEPDGDAAEQVRQALMDGRVAAADRLLLQDGAAADLENYDLEVAAALRRAGNLAEADSKLVAIADLRSADRVAVLAGLELASLRDYSRKEPRDYELQAVASMDFERYDPAVQAKAGIVACELQWALGRYGEMQATLSEALACAREAHDRPVEEAMLSGSIYRWQARAALLGPMPVDEAVAECDRLIDEPFSAYARHVVWAVRGGLEAMRGNEERAEEYFQQSSTIEEDYGRPSWIAALPLYRGLAHLVAGQWGEAVTALVGSPDALTQNVSRNATSWALLANAYAGVENDGAADDAAEKARSTAADDDLFTQVLWRVARASALSRSGNGATASAAATAAVSLAEQTDSPNLRGDAYAGLAAVVRRHEGESSDWRQQAETARDSYAEKGNVVGVQRMEEVIAS